MDDDRFDTLTRSVTSGGSRRRVMGLLSAVTLGALTPLLERVDADAGKRKKRKKNKKIGGSQPAPPAVCTPDCSRKSCGNNGCGGSCGTCGSRFVCSNEATGGTCVCPAGHDACQASATCCSECQTCDAGRDVCLMKPESDSAACEGGACCGGACCPPSCQCGVSGGNEDLARWFAEQQGWPYPFCAAQGTGQACGCSGSACPAGTTCHLIGGTCSGVCAAPCPGVDYPAG